MSRTPSLHGHWRETTAAFGLLGLMAVAGYLLFTDLIPYLTSFGGWAWDVGLNN